MRFSSSASSLSRPGSSCWCERAQLGIREHLAVVLDLLLQPLGSAPASTRAVS